MHHPKITIGLILYKGEKYLPFSLPSLVAQDYPEIEYFFRDQSPNGEAYDFIQKNLPDVASKVQLEKGENLWHSGGHNVLINRMSGEYYIAASYDMVYPPDFVRNIVAALEKPENKKYGSATCKLMRWEFSEKDAAASLSISGSPCLPATNHPPSNFLQKTKSNFIDSVGIGLTKGHYFFDYGQGEEDKGQFDDHAEVFGTSGALAIFRRQALKDIAFLNPHGRPEFFDELIHYKNDIDLSYRLQWAGWPCLFIPDVKVWHDRQAESEGKQSSILLNILKSRKNKADWVKANSFFGHLVVLAKNYHHRDFSMRVRLQTGYMNFLKHCYILVFEPSLLKEYQKMKTHRAEIEAKTQAMPIKMKARDIEKWMK